MALLESRAFLPPWDEMWSWASSQVKSPRSEEVWFMLNVHVSCFMMWLYRNWMWMWYVNKFPYIVCLFVFFNLFKNGWKQGENFLKHPSSVRTKGHWWSLTWCWADCIVLYLDLREDRRDTVLDLWQQLQETISFRRARSQAASSLSINRTWFPDRWSSIC